MTPTQRTDFVLRQVQEARKEMNFDTYAKMAAGIWLALDAATTDAASTQEPLPLTGVRNADSIS